MVTCALASCGKMQEAPAPRPVYSAYFESADNATPVELLHPKLKHLLHFWTGPRDKLSVISNALVSHFARESI